MPSEVRQNYKKIFEGDICANLNKEVSSIVISKCPCTRVLRPSSQRAATTFQAVHEWNISQSFLHCGRLALDMTSKRTYTAAKFVGSKLFVRYDDI